MPFIRFVEHPQWRAELRVIVDERVIEDVGAAVREDAGRYAPQGATRRLKNSFIMVKPRPLVRWVGSVLWYWRFPHYGTKPHEIRAGVRARSARRRPHRKMLAWPRMRVPIPKKAVRHPGSAENQFLKRALYKKRRIGPKGI